MVFSSHRLRRYGIAVLLSGAVLLLYLAWPRLQPASNDKAGRTGSTADVAGANADTADATAVRATMPSVRAGAPALFEQVLAEFAANELSAAPLGARHFDVLLQAAKNGDTRAARLLHAGLSRCRLRPSQEEYARLRSSIPEQGASLMNRRAMDELMRDCGGYSDRQLASDWEVVRVGAEFGDNELRVAYALLDPGSERSLEARLQNRRGEQRQRALGFLQQAAAQGYADAYLALGDAYARGLGTAADPLRAAAYKLAWLQQLQANGATATEIASFRASVEREFAQQSDNERLQASAFAQAILRGERQ